MSWHNYDSWRLATPWDSKQEIESLLTECYLCEHSFHKDDLHKDLSNYCFECGEIELTLRQKDNENE